MAENERPLGAQISHMLRQRGVDVIFGIPGVHNQEMYRGIEEAGITHVLARHEQGAGFMADGYARATGKPGVAYVITGPGLCNIMTPMGQAYSDSVPMLVVSSCLDETAARRGQLHQMKDQRAAAETVCDWSEEARSADAVYALIDRAFAEFAAKSPLPKHVQVPIAALVADAPPAPATPRVARRPVANAEDVAGAAQKITAAERPLFVFGGGAREASTAARAVLKLSGAASFTSYAGRGIAAPSDLLHFGASLARPGSAKIFEQADLIIFVGTDLAEVDLWRADPGHRCPTVIVNLDPEVLARSTSRDEVHMTDAGSWLSMLAAALQGNKAKTDWETGEVAATKARWRAEIDAERPGIVPICQALQDAAPSDTMIYSDMTQFAYVAKEIWEMDRPGHWHHPFGFGTLGYATPAAIGGAVGRPDQPTMAIMGDYGFHYTMQELGVAVELELGLPIILWDNGKLKEIEDSMVRAQIAPKAVVAHNPDFVKLAEAFGARAVAPANLQDMQEALRAAFDANRPTLIYLTPAVLGGRDG